jgi:hypothetical protein
MKSMEENPIPNMLLGSTAVLDRAPYHTAQENKFPTSSSYKAANITWLQNNKIAIALKIINK